jgi:ribosomal protein S6
MEEKIEKGDNMTVYEASYLLLPSLADSQVPGKAASIKDKLTSLGGEIISDENPVLIDLAYPMTKVVATVRHKETKGYFGWVKFEISTSEMENVKKAFDNDGEILRYLIIKTVRENTLLNGKMKLQKEEKAKKEEDVEAESVESTEEKEVPSEEIDKSIDDLVIA